MQTVDFPLTDEYIELISLLKYLNIAQTGGHAKMLVDDGAVLVNGTLESRRRYKVRKGDILVIGGEITVQIV
ncbi:MAG: RNA-binding S4 domain-containing protein [Bacteroidota bacterium]